MLTGTRAVEVEDESSRDERPFQLEDDAKKEKKQKPTKPHKPGKNETKTPHDDIYSYLTTPLLSALFVSFFIFFPILALGLYALSGIQVPPRMMDINKSTSVNKSRKDQ